MLRAFVRAVLIGTIAGAWMPTIFTTILALMMLGDPPSQMRSLLGFIYLIAFPSVLTFCMVMPSAILIGLPATAILRWFRAERAAIYSTVGSIAGAGVVLAILSAYDAESGWWLAVLGMFSGGVTGWTWGREREDLNPD